MHQLGMGLRRPIGGIWKSTAARFAIVSIVPIVGLGLVLSSALRDSVQSRTEAVYAEMTTAMFNMASDAIARPEDFKTQAPIPDERAAIIDELIRRIGIDQENVRVQIATPDRFVLYSNSADVVRQVADSEELRSALGGAPATRFVKSTDAATGTVVDVIQLYIPVRFPGDDTVHGVILASGIDTAMVDTIEGDVQGMRHTLAIGLAALWLVLLPISSSLSRRLRAKSEENEYLALHDALTGLPNRNLLADRLQHAAAASARTGCAVGLLLIDLDHFKEVNDTLGHTKGDELLQRVAQRLTRTARECDTVARLGGDEFAIVVSDLDSPDQLAAIAARVTEALGDAISVDLIEVAIQASVGGALYPAHADDPEELLQHADIAMYAAKASGDGFVMYGPEIDSHSPSRLALAADLGRALAADDQLVLHYQPVASPATGVVDAMEALVRWQHPTRGLLAPIDFIPMAEQSGLIRRVTSHVLDLAISQVRTWMDAGLDLTVAVNLSASDLGSMSLPGEVDAILTRYRVPASMLELEVTETGVLAHPEKAVELVTTLQAMGVRIALDDFGTGYSSLTYLKRLNPDRLKIDRGFVDAMTHQTTDAQIVRSLIDLAHNLAIGVTAEGVETQQQWDLLRGLACDLVQGYYLARPLEAGAATAWLSERNPRRALSPTSSH